MNAVQRNERTENETVASGQTFLSICSLNGARFAGEFAEEEHPTLCWLKGLSCPDADVPDVLCLQDVRVSLLQFLGPLPYFHFVPMTNSMYFGRRELLGICIASKWPITHIDVHQTWGSSHVQNLEGVDQNNQRIQPLDLSDSLVLKTQNRVAVACSVLAPGSGEGIRVATHHGFWTRDGACTPDQLRSTQSVTNFLVQQAGTYGGLVYLADYNPDKYGKVYAAYRASGAADWLPPDVKTTLAPEHPAARLGVKSDCIFTWPDAHGESTYSVFNVNLDDAPGSDHLMLRCSVTLAAGR